MLTLLQLGRLHPDEVYQFLEPAQQRAFGYSIVAWEWNTGLRNWAIPGVFAVLLKLCAAAGIDDPWKRRAVLELPQAALNLWMLWAAWRLAARRVNPDLARWAIPFVGLYMPVLTFAGRTLGESFSAAFLVIGLELLDREGSLSLPGGDPSTPLRSAQEVGVRGAALAGGAVLGLSVVARYGSAAAVMGAMLFLLASRRFMKFAQAAAGGAAVALALGALDWATWGAPFHSLREYLQFNVLTDKAAKEFGSQPLTVYLPYLALLAPWAWLGFFKRPSGVFVAAGAAYLLAICLTEHKEPRFLYPALVLLSVGALPGALELVTRRGLGATAAACALSLSFFFFEHELKPQRGDQFRLEARAWPQATGLMIIPEGVWGAGGFFWVGKNIPWRTIDFGEQVLMLARDPTFNRVVSIGDRGAAELEAAGFHVLATDGHGKLWGRGD